MLLLLLPVAFADLPAAERWVASDHVAIGVAADGSLVNDAVRLGLLVDYDGPDGPAPLGSDLLRSGNAFEAWGAQYEVDGQAVAWSNNAAYLGSAFSLTWDDPYDDGATAWIHGAGEAQGVVLDAWIGAAWGEGVATLVVRFTAVDDLTDLRVSRALDPDPDVFVTGSYATTSSTGTTEGVGWAAAEGAWDARAVALAVVGGEGRVCAWCDLPDEVAGGSVGPSTGDDQVGVWVALPDLAAGDSVDVAFHYGFAFGADAAAQAASAAALAGDYDRDGATDDDCDPFDATVFPGAPEHADGRDEDCDGAIDESLPDVDDDGDGYSEWQGDCDDTRADVYPGSPSGDCTDAGWEPDVPADVEESQEVSHGACSTGPTPRSAVLAALAGLLLAARRRSTP